MEFTRESIIKRLNELNMTQKELAKAVGGSQANISRLLLNIGKVKTRDKTIYKLEQALGIKFGVGPIDTPKNATNNLYTCINDLFNSNIDISEIVVTRGHETIRLKR